MRRKDREVADVDEIRSILLASTECHIALCVDNQPYGVSMNFGFTEDDGAFVIWLHCAQEGRKIDILSANPRAYFFTENGCCFQETVLPHGGSSMTMLYASVAGYGNIEFIVDDNEKKRGLAALTSRFSKTPISAFPDAVLQKTCVLKLILEGVTAKRNPK